MKRNSNWFFLGEKDDYDVFFDQLSRTVFSVKDSLHYLVMDHFDVGEQPIAISGTLIVYYVKDVNRKGILVKGRSNKFVATDKGVYAAKISKDEDEVFISFTDISEIGVYNIKKNEFRMLSFSGLVFGATDRHIYYAKQKEDIVANVTDVYKGDLITGQSYLLAESVSGEDLSVSTDGRFLFANRYLEKKPSGGFFPAIFCLMNGEVFMIDRAPAENYLGPFWTSDSKTLIFIDGKKMRRIPTPNPCFVEGN